MFNNSLYKNKGRNQMHTAQHNIKTIWQVKKTQNCTQCYKNFKMEAAYFSRSVN